MSGSPSWVWLCLVGGMLLQLSYMILPFQRWDWARYLGRAALPLLMLAKADNEHVAIGADEGLFSCRVFTLCFARFFQDRLLPRLGEAARPHTMVLIEEVKDGGYARADEVFTIPEAYRAKD